MDKLKSKTFYTIFLLITIFGGVAVGFFNIQNYRNEYLGIKNNLIRMSDLSNQKPREFDEPNKMMEKSDFDNRIVMDYDFYTIILDRDNNIIDKISHNENAFDDELLSKANKIIADNAESKIRIGFLYLGNMAYNYSQGNYLTLVDTSRVQERLISLLVVSLLLLIIYEIVGYFIAKRISDWITRPVEESFNKQKEFIANASHELKTPVAVMMASLDCLSVSKKNEKWVNILKSEADRMSNLITRLLILSKTENKMDKETFVVNDISRIIEKRVLTLESIAYENRVSINTEIFEGINIKCNPVDIDELISILIDNAIKHSEENSEVVVKLYLEKTNVIIDVINKGKEIPKEDVDKIFERFYRGDESRNRNANRYGLGLAIAKNIVLNHDGEIKAFSQKGYTTFRVLLKNNK